MDMIATNIRLSRKTLESLKITAVKSHKSLAQLIREAVEKVYGLQQRSQLTQHTRDPFYKLMGIGKSGIRDGSIHHDRDIYKFY